MPLALSFSAASSTFFWINSTKDQKKFHPESNPKKKLISVTARKQHKKANFSTSIFKISCDQIEPKAT